VAGFRSERVFRGGELSGYDLVDLVSARRTKWLRREAEGERIGPFVIIPEGFSAAAAIIRGSAPRGILAVDELGPAELEGRGFWPALGPLLGAADRSFLFVVRTACLAGFHELFADHPAIVFRVGGSVTPDEAVREILSRDRQG
jgi:nucleoside-triphosphatase THEP1